MLLADFFLTCPWQTLKKEPVKRSIGEHVTEASLRERAGRARTRADSHARSAISKEKLEGLNRLVQKDTQKTIPWSATHTRLGPIMDFLSPHLQMLQFFLMRGRVGGYPIPQCRKKNWQIRKFRVENWRNTYTAFMISHAYFNVVSISCVFLISQACIHQKSTLAFARKREISNWSVQRSKSKVIGCPTNFIIE